MDGNLTANEKRSAETDRMESQIRPLVGFAGREVVENALDFRALREDVRRYALQQIRCEARRVSGCALRRLNCPQRYDIAAVGEGRERQCREILP